MKTLIYFSLIWLVIGCQVIAPRSKVSFIISCSNCSFDFDIQNCNQTAPKDSKVRNNWNSDTYTAKSKHTIVDLIITNNGAGYVAGQIIVDGKLKATEAQTFANAKTNILRVHASTY